jgi:heme/copper-type cytochrome/quinol oxidase subunit 2
MNDQQVQQPQMPPPNYLVWAILTTVLCCLPFGIVSIVFASQVNSKWAAGDYDGAKNSSKNAKTWAWVSFAAAIFVSVIWFVLVAFGIIAGGLLDAIDF